MGVASLRRPPHARYPYTTVGQLGEKYGFRRLGSVISSWCALPLHELVRSSSTKIKGLHCGHMNRRPRSPVLRSAVDKRQLHCALLGQKRAD